MTIDLIKQTLKYTIFLGLIGMFIAWAFGLSSTFVETKNINSVEILTFNWYTYLDSLNNAWSTDALNFEDIIPTRTWDETGFDFWNQNQFWGAVINNMAFVFDWVYFPINFIAFILRWICWIIRLALALIGWDFTVKPNGVYNSVLIQTLTWITQNLMIPYI